MTLQIRIVILVRGSEYFWPESCGIDPWGVNPARCTFPRVRADLPIGLWGALPSSRRKCRLRAREGWVTNHMLQGGLYHMLQFAKKFIRDERGEDLMEYGLLVAFVATIALAVIITDPLGFGTAIQDAYQRAVDALNQA